MEYSFTNKFILIPNDYNNSDESIIAFRNLFNLSDTEEVYLKDIEKLNAKLFCCNENPFIEYLIDYSYQISEYNKVLIHYNASKEILHIVVSKGEILELVNTFKANCFKTALYFIFLALKQTIINPQQTVIRVFHKLTDEEHKLLETYFKGIDIINTENKIIE